MIHPWLGIALMLALLGALLVALAPLSRRYPPEVARKSLHVGMGLATLSFPWLFERTWPVLLLACTSLLAFLALSASSTLKRRFGCAIHQVPRASQGEMHFVLGTAAVFVLSAGDALMFCIPMLVLTLADAAAGLTGTAYGHHRFASCLGQKSVEGSAAFFVVALGCVYLPLLVAAPVHTAEQAAVAVFVAAITTGLEAIAGRGLDNLLVPVGAFVALKAGGISGNISAAGGYEPAAQIALLAAVILIALIGMLAVHGRLIPGAPGTARRIDQT